MIVLSKCVECKHLLYNEVKDNLDPFKCKAFPDGIPFDVYKSHENVPCTEEISFEPEE